MNARSLLSLVGGVVRAECAGGFFDKFLSAALVEGVEPFDVALSGVETRFCVSARDYKKLRRAARSSQCRMRIIEKRGLPFVVRRIKNLLPLCAGIVVMLAVASALGGTVITIDIEGSSVIPRSQIMSSLARCGLEIGMPRSRVDVKRLEQQLLLDNKRLSWAAVNLSYGRAVVELRDKHDDAHYAVGPAGVAIVARRDAQIVKITVVSGEALVKEGETVSAGQPLVAAQELMNESSWTAGVSAQTLGRTYFRERFEAGFYHVFRERTGRIERASSLSLGGVTLPLGAQKTSFRWYDSLEYSEPLTLFSVRLPLIINTKEYYEINQRSVRLTPSAARALLLDKKAEYERDALAQADILYQNAEFAQTERGWALDIEYICLEEIGEYYCP